jgi:hypothetical protein
MWRIAEIEMSPEVRGLTTTVWQYDDVVQVGVMRQSMLRPPVLWAKLLTVNIENLRKGPAILDQLQQFIYAPVILAETEAAKARDTALLLFLGFTQEPTVADRHQFKRSLSWHS